MNLQKERKQNNETSAKDWYMSCLIKNSTDQWSLWKESFGKQGFACKGWSQVRYAYDFHSSGSLIDYALKKGTFVINRKANERYV